VLARLPRQPGAEYFWMAYPRSERETLPPAVQLAPGVMKVTTSESTDYVFLSTRGLKYEGENVVFEGGAGAVRLGKDGTVTLAMVGGAGKIGHKGFIVEGTAPLERTLKAAELKAGTEKAALPTALVYAPQLKDHHEVSPGLRKAVAGDVTEYLVEFAAPVLAADSNVRVEARRAALHVSPSAARFVAPERTFVQLTVGNQGVRGVGPFDLTFAADKITGTVDGDIRTLVVTRPPKAIKPMYHMDGWRYYAGHADDSSADDGRQTAQFNGITMRDPSIWTVVPVACQDVQIRNVKLIGLWRYNSDGIDFVNTQQGRLEDSLIRSLDDCVVFKGRRDWRGFKPSAEPVADIQVRRWVLWNDWGVAVASEMRGILVEDCDIIHTSLAAVGIHNSDRGRCHAIDFRNIRIEMDDDITRPAFQQRKDQVYKVPPGDRYVPSLVEMVIFKERNTTDSERGHIFASRTSP